MIELNYLDIYFDELHVVLRMGEWETKEKQKGYFF